MMTAWSQLCVGSGRFFSLTISLYFFKSKAHEPVTFGCLSGHLGDAGPGLGDLEGANEGALEGAFEGIAELAGDGSRVDCCVLQSLLKGFCHGELFCGCCGVTSGLRARLRKLPADRGRTMAFCPAHSALAAVRPAICRP